MGPLHLFQHPSTLSSSRKNHPISQTRVLAHLAAIFDLLARNSVSETVLGDCSSVCDSSVGPISFCSSGLLFAHLAFVGDHVLDCMSNLYGSN